MRAALIVVLLVLTAGLYWFRWRPVQGEIAMLHAREEVEQRAVETATVGLQGRVELTSAMVALRRRLDNAVPIVSHDPDTDALVDVTKLARSCRLEVLSISAATVATPSPVALPPAASVAAVPSPPIVSVPLSDPSPVPAGDPASFRYARIITVHGSLGNELAMVDGFSALRPLIEVEGVTFRASIRGGVDAGIAYAAIAMQPAMATESGR